MTSVVVGDNVTSIGDDAFHGCDGLTSVVIGDSVTSIGKDAFYNCLGLASIIFEGTVARWNSHFTYYDWNGYVPATEVICSAGVVKLK